MTTDRSEQGISVIVPVAPGDGAWQLLLLDLRFLPLGSEILFVGPSIPLDFYKRDPQSRLPECRWISSVLGRGAQLNQGARHAKGKYFWFLHADTRVSSSAIELLAASLEVNRQSLIYFNLRFLDDGPRLVRLNALGSWIRSHIFGIPFGDQGFCLSRETFDRLGGFNENCAYGEDHLFVWTARRARVPLCCLNATLSTSARKYRENGWLGTTLSHLFLTARQAFPEFIKLARIRF